MRIDVLDNGFVELQDIMGDDLAIVNAARTSYLGESKGYEQDMKLLRYLMVNRHMSPFEMVEFKFLIKLPVVVMWQLVRHRTANINSQSGRYTDFPDEFYVPDTWRLQSSTNKQGSDGEVDADTHNFLTDAYASHLKQSYWLYQTALDMGVAKEQARLFLPAWSSYYTIVWKIDARNLMNVLEQRLDHHAQWEMRQYAEALWEIFKQKLPETGKLFQELYLDKNND